MNNIKFMMIFVLFMSFNCFPSEEYEFDKQYRIRKELAPVQQQFFIGEADDVNSVQINKNNAPTVFRTFLKREQEGYNPSPMNYIILYNKASWDESQLCNKRDDNKYNLSTENNERADFELSEQDRVAELEKRNKELWEQLKNIMIFIYRTKKIGNWQKTKTMIMELNRVTSYQIGGSESLQIIYNAAKLQANEQVSLW